MVVNALKECDIIMKGGITSGVVYPKALLKLSESYRFRSIGGTSAGAIAAVITAAAEFNRDGGGYDTIAEIPAEVQQRLLTLFQPSPELRPVFEAALLVMDGKKAGAFRRILSGNRRVVVGWTAVGGMLAVLAAGFGDHLGALLLLLIGFAVGLGAMIVGLVRKTLRDLVKADFGFCPGKTEPGHSDPGLSDWLAEKIEVAAGRMTAGAAPPQRPFTFGDIWAGKDGQGTPDERAIDLRMMTTNLSLRRPNALPHMDGNHYFIEDEFRRLFPDWIVDYLVRKARENEQQRKLNDPREKDDPPGFHRFPIEADLPLVVAARMSLSFPILFAAVPLHRHDYPHEHDGPPLMQRMLFSDGGLSSNFPVHFFDALLPNRPTFGISLEAYDERDKKRRVHMSMKARDGMWLDSLPVDTLPDFLMSLVNAAKDWQDRLQSTLPGYRERIASVYLKDEEGGLNLTMTPAQIEGLVGLGERAGGLMTGTPLSPDDTEQFDFDDHRWRRFLVAFARLEETLGRASASWTQPNEPTRDFISGYMGAPGSYNRSPKQWRADVFARFDALMTLVAGWSGSPLRDAGDGYIPKPDTTMRITPVS